MVDGAAGSMDGARGCAPQRSRPVEPPSTCSPWRSPLACAAGGGGSYMSVMPFANSLMLDFRCLVVPRFVYTTGAAFDADLQLTDEKIRQRVDDLCAELVRVTGALA